MDNYNKKLLLTTLLLLVILLTTLSVFTFNLTLNNTDNGKMYVEGVINVGNERELKAAIRNAPSYIFTIIALDKDVSLADTTLEIPSDKHITLTSLDVSKGVF
ncbi:MAG: hypothetical protein FWF66_01220 [Candidatus Bathyarchaeota archaeon]|nr:hypothetical protein [Candidatus Termiticorpusculum sp.]